jgi:putative flippase GtrA
MISEIIDTVNSFITSKFKILQNTNFFKIFTRIFNLKILNENKEMVLYLIFGVLTTFVNIMSYLFFSKVCGINILISNIMAWFFSIVFAYVTNRILVFESKNEKILHEFVLFITGRGLSGILDTLLFYVLVFLLMFNDIVSKIVINIIVIVINYVLSKKIIFKEK